MTKQSDISGRHRAASAPPDPQSATAGQDTARGLETRPLPAADLDSASSAAADDQGDATVLRPAVRPQPEPPAQGPVRKNTLASAATRPVQPAEREALSAMPQATPPTVAAHATLARQPSQPSIPDEMEDEADEWATADQPTVYLPPKRALRASHPDLAPSYPDPAAASRAARAPAERDPDLPASHRAQATPHPRTLGQVARTVGQGPYDGPRYASPTGRPMPATPPEGISRAALPDPRMQRFQELRQRRLAYQAGEQPVDRTKPVAETVRQWWGDLAPGLQNALHYQHEARASGVHPIPPHVPTTMTRLGDAFGRFAASARELAERTQAAVAPALKRIQDHAGRLHDQAEQQAGAIVEKIEGAAPARQQGPLLGPGRIAVFFKQGVTVDQAQGLLAANRARPIRLIPRKHGFLAFVPAGSEAAVAERLRQHPYIRDVEYLQFDEFGQALDQAE